MTETSAYTGTTGGSSTQATPPPETTMTAAAPTTNKNDANAAVALTGLSNSPDQQQQDGPTVASSVEKKDSTTPSLDVAKTFPQIVSFSADVSLFAVVVGVIEASFSLRGSNTFLFAAFSSFLSFSPLSSMLQLMEILSDPKNEECISWLPHGCSFRIHNRTRFLDEILPHYYNNKKIKYTSFTRKLSRWDFVRLSSGPDTGAFYHKMFQRDNPHLARKMYCKGERPQFVRTLGSLSGAAQMLPGTFGGIGWGTALGLSGLTQQQVPGGSDQQMGSLSTGAAGAPGAPDMSAFMANMNNPAFKANMLAQQQLLQQQQLILQQQLAASGAAPMQAGINNMQQSKDQQQQEERPLEQQQSQPQNHQHSQTQNQQELQQPQINQDQLLQLQQQIAAQQVALMTPQSYLTSPKLDKTDNSAIIQQHVMSAGHQKSGESSSGANDATPNGSTRAWAA